MKNLTTNLILKHFHGFTLEQWNTDLRHKFPYCEVEAITEDVLSALKDAYDLIPDNTESDKLPNIKRLLKEAEHQARQQPSLSELRKTVYEVPDEMKQAIFNKSTEGNAQQPVRKTLDECKDEVARNYKHDDWDSMLNHVEHYPCSINKACDEVAELYAQTKAVEPQEGWVDVKDRLPETFERIGGYYVLVYGRGKLCYGDVVWVENNLFISNDGDVTDLVTHWMPLPNSPKQ